MSKCGSLIRRARKKVGLTQEELASLLGYGSGQLISNIERCISDIPMERVREYANHLKIRQSEILRAIQDDKIDRVRAKFQRGA